MDLQQRKDLTAALSRLVADIAADLRDQIRTPGEAQERARQVWLDEKVGDDFMVWTDLLARRAAVLWVLKSVYVRVLEDRGLCRPLRIVDRESHDLFERLAPNLGDTAYLRWVYADLASPDGGLPELFSPQPAEVAWPSDARSQDLLRFWRAPDPDTGALRWRFDDEHFDGRLMGDLYQDLDPVVKARYALLQTPDFVLDFILDETLTPAIDEWGVETVRVLDPACGSGHFLLAAFKRLVAGMRDKFRDRPVKEVVKDCLARVVGIDLNDYACALARARLVMTALELCRESELAAASDFHPQVYWADALEQVERDEPEQQLLPGMGFEVEKPKALLTRPEVREALRPILRRGFHVVVGNPPFDVEKDARKRAYQKEVVGKSRRYISASGKYSLCAPFVERMIQVSTDQGHIGLISANSFTKNEFGRELIEKVLPRFDLKEVLDSSGVYIPGAAIPTVMLFIKAKPPTSDVIPVTMKKRGEPVTPNDPSRGLAWTSLIAGHRTIGYEDEFVSVSLVSRQTLSKHPWSIGGGGAAELKARLEESAHMIVSRMAESVGIASFTLEDDVFLRPLRAWQRIGLPSHLCWPMISGDSIRNWSVGEIEHTMFPYGPELRVLDATEPSLMLLWLYRTNLANGLLFGGKTKVEGGLRWYEFGRLTADKLRSPLTIAYSEFATHNHFILDRGGSVFNRSAPIIKLGHESKAEHLTLLAQLNSSAIAFYLRQICRDMGGGGNGRGISDEVWELRIRPNATKVEQVPIAAISHPQLQAFAAHIDALARSRVEDSAPASINAHATSGPAPLRKALEARHQRDLDALYKMVGLQEELDWLCYKLYGIDPDAEVRDPEDVPPLRPGLRPFEITLARADAERREALARGEEPDEAPTAWFERHGWQPCTTTDSLDPRERALVEARIARTEASRDLALVEQPTYKRRWYRPDHAAEEKAALTEWLADRIEAWAKTRTEPFTIVQAAAALQGDPAVLAVAEVREGRADFDLEKLAAELIQADAVPNNKYDVFKPEGLVKRAAWEETWRLQHREDAGEKLTIPVPPKYASSDYQKPDYWHHRGKLDVPKERFIAFTEVPRREGPAGALFGWAGWTPRQRARVLLELDEQAETEGVPLEERIGLLYGAWFLVPYVAWESKDAAEEFAAIVKGAVGDAGVTEEMGRRWAEGRSVAKPVRGRGRGKR
ncbi:BREX-2 system adenine-specific DNA-methyltransferase PglX [Polyangium spumosum]|uniref:site-specific DNA-methyltransferase (adenine-specific) n=1 Tax=Polyangium spumosum TaxID=889282 RepID=A0A6N7Q1S0_9BACT|nr:BREX-2 system adenine-specific DNA-methyltransferase PglX [Polyangium spumosum]MRG98412.1 BREX-2 system adenine-specific DNA-methyltransferase PglX [Polyangium spumosum]